MNELLSVMRDIIPTQASRRWSYEVDLRHSCFRLENASLKRVIFSGYGNERMEEVAVSVSIRLTIGESFHLQIVKIETRGVREALIALFDFPDAFVVCRECGTVRNHLHSPSCASCLFLAAFSQHKNVQETCSICQDPAFRTMLPCGHFFHMTCLLGMDSENVRCPNCRTAVPDSLVDSLFGSEPYDDESGEED